MAPSLWLEREANANQEDHKAMNSIGRAHAGRARFVLLFALAVTAASVALGQPATVGASSSTPSADRVLVDPHLANPSGTTAAAPTPDGNGFWTVTGGGLVTVQGDASFFGDISTLALNGSIVSIAPTFDGLGYWLLGSDGGVFSFGDARFYGSTGSLGLNSRALQMVSTPDSKGYWFVAGDGGIFSFGDAAFYGSTGSFHLNRPVVGMAATKDGSGYWLVAADGGIFSFGNASFQGSTGSITLNEPMVGMASTVNSRGYWLVAADGGIFAFGDATFYGSAASSAPPSTVVSIVATGDGAGYWIIGNAGTIYSYGDAPGTAGVPVLGTYFLPDFIGFGSAQPATVHFGIDGYSEVAGITWTAWGAAQATGTGEGWYVPSGYSMGQGWPEPATVVAYSLGTCGGGPAYTQLSIYFPGQGESFNPSFYMDTCFRQWLTP